jgi:hypothetical protein
MEGRVTAANSFPLGSNGPFGFPNGCTQFILHCRMKISIAIFFAANLLFASSGAAWAEPVERHPELHGAIHALEVARHRLERANHDFGGHRDEALKECDRAIEQLKLALKFDRE